VKKFKNLFRILFFLAIISAVSCEKIIDFLPGKSKECRIKRIHFVQSYSEYYGDFYYNKFGNPDSVMFGFVATGSPNLYFKYNNKNQLRENRFLYSDGFFETWHKYGYSGKVITTDTIYWWGWGDRDPEPGNYYYKAIIYFEYDELGRIIKETYDATDPDYPPSALTYSYDSNGNLGNYSSSYDRYRNIHTLNPIWQFLTRDYSLNNPIPATSYNNFRLPLTFDEAHPPGSFIYDFMNRSLEKATIEYDCK
jgi:hypothetical protein